MAAEDRGGMAVALTCKDMASSVSFYRDTLGFTMKESWPDEASPMWCNMVLGPQSVMLGMAMDVQTAEQMCGNDPVGLPHFKRAAERFARHPAGVGIQIYLQVDDVDRYHAEIGKKGAQALIAPRTQFYGIRELHVDDPDGYRLVFYTPVAMESCQSCGMPLKDAEPGQMYCPYCTDDHGKLRPYEQVLEGTVSGYFMAMKKMDRASAEKAAREHLKQQPAWGMHA